MNEDSLVLVDPQSGHLAFRWHSFEDGADFRALNRFNYFSVILVMEGRGTVISDVSSDASAFPFAAPGLLTFSLYQPFKIESEGVFKGVMVNFHPEFFCLHKHRHEVSCNGILFNNIYEPPLLALGDAGAASLLLLMRGIEDEMRRPGIAQMEAVLSYLKLLLINASRMKLERRGLAGGDISPEPEVLIRLKTAIEEHFASLHSPGDYAGLLNISNAALNKVVKGTVNKTLSQLIAERIITEGKRRLYLSAKPVKQIAFELGYNDEFYFSRFFKTNVGASPQLFRDTVGFDRADA
jgi:AraC family transcriptional activator of pobA